MTLKELIAAFRSAADDSVDPYHWSDREVTSWLHEAEVEAASRANLLIEAQDSDFCDITLVAGTAFYKLNDQIKTPMRIAINGQPLIKATRDQLDIISAYWESETGTPRNYIHTGQYIQVYPVPTEAGTLNMVVSRLPGDMTSIGPEIPEKYHLRLLPWVLFLAFSKRGIETYDPSAANVNAAKFEKYFGASSTANVIEQRLNTRPGTPTNRPTWI